MLLLKAYAVKTRDQTLIQSREKCRDDNLSFSSVKIATTMGREMILITHKFRHCLISIRDPFSHRSRAALPHRKHKSKPRLPRSSTYFATRAGLITSTIARCLFISVYRLWSTFTWWKKNEEDPSIFACPPRYVDIIQDVASAFDTLVVNL